MFDGVMEAFLRRMAFISPHNCFSCISLWQSYWKGYIARKDSMAQLLDLRLRMQQSAANVDDSMRLINRLVAALSELLSMRSVSGILHTCATLGEHFIFVFEVYISNFLLTFSLNQQF